MEDKSTALLFRLRPGSRMFKKSLLGAVPCQFAGYTDPPTTYRVLCYHPRECPLEVWLGHEMTFDVLLRW